MVTTPSRGTVKYPDIFPDSTWHFPHAEVTHIMHRSSVIMKYSTQHNAEHTTSHQLNYYTVRHNYGTPWFLFYSFWTNRQKMTKFRLCCHKQQQHFKLLAQLCVQSDRLSLTRTKMCTPQPDCRINNDVRRTDTLCSKVSKFSDTACSILMNCGNLYLEQQHSKN